MPALTKAHLLKTVRHHINTNFLRRFLKDQLGPKTTAKSMEDALEILNGNFTKEDIQDFLFDHCHTMKHHTFVFETEELTALNATSLDRKLRAAIPTVHEDKVLLVKNDLANKKVLGFAVTKIKAQSLAAGGGYSGSAKVIEALIPFQIIFHGTTHAKVKVSKFAPAFIQDAQGSDLEVLENLFDEEEFAQFVHRNIFELYCPDTFVRSDLTTGVKKLVKDLRLGTMIAKAQLPSGKAIEQRTMNRIEGDGLLVEQSWFDTWFYESAWIGTSKWYWLNEGTPNPTETKDLFSHTIDAAIGKVSQDSFVDENLEELINEVISSNS